MWIRAFRVSVNVFFSSEVITEDNAVFISSLLDPHAEHLVNLLMKSQLPRSITRGVGLLELFPWSFWGEEQFGTVLVL